MAAAKERLLKLRRTVGFTNMDGNTSHEPSTSHTVAEPTCKRERTRVVRTNHRPTIVEISTVNVNHLGQVFGPHSTEFSTFLGTIARTLTTLSLNFDDWRLVPRYYKEETLIEIEVGYETPLFRKLADKVAAAGFLVVAPDFFYGDPFDMHKNKTDWLVAHQAVGLYPC
ncbi:hypothetical protein NE237_022839 [Protea cynaroides]|uniref:Uncharacterized protein n=1 Tax=Protea cynaroides TaxID=273540 RepID=A0A9Q0K5M7_9MAGN|nr:hypothetical protein NE237_022839 [Protea cynaroides]